MIHTLWLVSWYPSKASSQNGDFIQRHARAVLRFANVYVLHVVPYTESKTDIQQQANLTEEIVYYKKNGNSWMSKLFSFCRYIYLYQKHIRHYIKTYGKPNVVHVHISMRAGLLALWLKKEYHIPYVVTEHWTLFTQERKNNFLRKNFLFKYFTKKIFKHAVAILPVSNSLGKSIQQMVINIPFTKIPNVVNDDFYFKKMEENLPFTFIHVSSLNELKNPKGIIRAFAEVLKTHPNIRLKIVGNDFDNLIKYVNKLKIPNDKIIFTGEVSNEQVAIEMQAAHAFVLFSQAETFGCVIVESLCCGNPVIATDVGGVSEQLDDTNSILIPANDEYALVAAMKNMIENYAQYDREKIAERAKALYNYDVVGKQIVEVYQSVIGHYK